MRHNFFTFANIINVTTAVILMMPDILCAKTILCLGDSLTEGYQLKREEAWPALIENELKVKDPSVKVINAGISGATSASGPTRMKWHLKNLQKQPIDIVVIALGANDALRGLTVSSAKQNLEATIDLAKNAGIKVLLVGMKAPPSLGGQYTKEFESIYKQLSKEKNVDLVPFMLEGVAADPKLNLPDGIHPNALGHKIVASTIQKSLMTLIATK